MQRVSRTFRLFQMSALRISTGFLFLFSILFSCGDDATVIDAQKNSEALPRVDAALFRSVKKDEFTLEVLKEMSENRVSGTILYDADYLPKEYHFTIEKTPVARFRKDPTFPKDQKVQLRWFARKKSKELMERLRRSKAEKQVKVTVNKQECFKQIVTGKEYGFPLAKKYFLRYYKSNDSFITITAWTIEKEANSFEKLAQYMGMKFQLTD